MHRRHLHRHPDRQPRRPVRHSPVPRSQHGRGRHPPRHRRPQLFAGIATFTTSTLSLGTHRISVAFAANQNFPAATSNIIQQKIVSNATPVATATYLSSSFNPSGQGQPITFTANVQQLGPFSQPPAGMVNFEDAGATIGTAALTPSGLATFTTSTLAFGIHPITASYVGTSTGTLPAQPSVSATLSQVILTALPQAPLGFSLGVTPAPATVGVGRTAIFQVTVTPLSGFAQPVSLSCSGLPYESACTFLEPTIPSAGGITTLQLSTSAPHDCGNPGAPYCPRQSHPFEPHAIRPRRRPTPWPPSSSPASPEEASSANAARPSPARTLPTARASSTA